MTGMVDSKIYDIGRYYGKLVKSMWDRPCDTLAQTNSPIWCLGRKYSLHVQSSSSPELEAKTESVTEPVAVTVAPASVDANADTFNVTVSDIHTTTTTTSTSTTTAAENDPPPSPSQNSLTYPNASSTLADNLINPRLPTTAPPPLLDDFEAKIWMTYRSNFPPIPRSPHSPLYSLPVRILNHLCRYPDSFSSDTGWGCMIRSGQSLLANALIILLLGRDWRRGRNLSEETNILSLFADTPMAPFSIHKFVQHGLVSCDTHPGEWFGPSITAKAIQALVNNYPKCPLRIFHPDSGSEVYQDDFLRIAQSPCPESRSSGCSVCLQHVSAPSSNSSIFHPTLLLIATRLGIDNVTPVYWRSLLNTFQMTQSVGVSGGRPSSAHYFVAAQDEYLYFLDPHVTRSAETFPDPTPQDPLPAFTVNPLPSSSDTFPHSHVTSPDPPATAPEHDPTSSYHTRELGKIHISEIDPSMLLGFLITNLSDWDAWKSCVQKQSLPQISPISTHDHHGVNPVPCTAEHDSSESIGNECDKWSLRKPFTRASQFPSFTLSGKPKRNTQTPEPGSHQSDHDTTAMPSVIRSKPVIYVYDRSPDVPYNMNDQLDQTLNSKRTRHPAGVRDINPSSSTYHQTGHCTKVIRKKGHPNFQSNVTNHGGDDAERNCHDSSGDDGDIWSLCESDEA